jgi:hypothetical protein
MGEVLVGLLLPARAPDELVAVGERVQVPGGGGRKEMRDAVDLGPGARGRGVGREAEEGDHPVDVDEEQRPVA